MKRYGFILGAFAVLTLLAVVTVSITRYQSVPGTAFAGPGPTPTPDCSVTSWDFEGVNCFALGGLWHHETVANVPGMTGDTLAFNIDGSCDAFDLDDCTYDTGNLEYGRMESPSFTATNGAQLSFKTARETEEFCDLPDIPAIADLTIVLYSTDNGTNYLPLDLLTTGSISAGLQDLQSGGIICNTDLTAQTVWVKLPAGTTNIAFDFATVDPLFNDFAGQFIDDVVVNACSPPACPTQTPTHTSTPTITETPTPTATGTATATGTPFPTGTPTITATPKSSPAPKATPTVNGSATGAMRIDADCEVPASDESVETQRIVEAGASFHICVAAVFPGSETATGYQARVHWKEAALDLVPRTAGTNDLWHLQSPGNGGPPNGAIPSQTLGPADDDTGSDAYVSLESVDSLDDSASPAFVGAVAQFEFVCQTHGAAGNIELLLPGDSAGSAFTSGTGEIKPVLASALIICLDPDLDSDNDGCTNAQETGSNEALGGQRDPLHRWDFYDIAIGGPARGQDGIVDLFNDVVSVINHYAPVGTEPAYDAWYDRGPVDGPNAWNLTAPDGKIDLFNDIVGVINQYFHDCR